MPANSKGEREPVRLKRAFLEALVKVENTGRPVYLIDCKCPTEHIRLESGGVCDNYHYVRAIVFPPQVREKT